MQINLQTNGSWLGVETLTCSEHAAMQFVLNARRHATRALRADRAEEITIIKCEHSFDGAALELLYNALKDIKKQKGYAAAVRRVCA